jgi:hypothetical protein
VLFLPLEGLVDLDGFYEVRSVRSVIHRCPLVYDSFDVRVDALKAMVNW